MIDINTLYLESKKSIKSYREYREISKILNDKIFDYLETTQKGLNDINIMGLLKNNRVYLDKNIEFDYCHDFILYEKTLNNKSGVDLFLESHKLEDKSEIELIESMKNSKTSLYKVIDIDKKDFKIKIEDINTKEIINIIDISLSRTLDKDHLVFTRIISIGDVNFTSGMVMLFNLNHIDFLERVAKKEMKKLNIENENVKRFITFFYLSRQHGYNMTLTPTT
ncbi:MULTISPECIES: hypothetical protein [Romboutsia]|uniref:Uncharacterized protein n=1 Tax=Romboutsia hominis TaxID=1507512 RepID=A0A2P2BP44_9FIRM|nr:MULTISPECIES: hypothetical protein [Romboutsia]MDB8790330.1 hypothetical protein [Romboutsia sp. 1001216sp1]MDB8792237.1 hypothetical protein [Romboutsia sp. 1001216sp1]MDB8795531.1 hypothetical protein [Romboutsia sp. 1001216sp1]MDB8798590.1 hypothetical protein [Romboutsia sp. 1001216sp1]MDB8800696.1 hypothetical protein [Romboutsia sp. 1001216sp1]